MEIHSSFNSLGRIGQQRSPFIFEIANKPCNGDYEPKFEKFQWHHIVPQSLRNENIFQKGGLLAGFLFDEGKNCVALPTSQDPCDKIGADAPTTHEGRHIDAYKDGMKKLFDDWEGLVQESKMTPTQVKQEFAAFLLGMRLNLDPGLMAT